MREIKFRAWDGMTNKMFNWKQLRKSKKHNFLEAVELQDTGVILMQFTGLKDKNGKEIFEGDIIKAIYEDKEEFGEVYFDEFSASFDVRGECWLSVEDLTCSDKYYEVIGNIYENPKLIEVKK